MMMLTRIALSLYSLLMALVLVLLWSARYFSKTLKHQMGDRHFFSLPRGLVGVSSSPQTWLFFCSSAGEYEQAKPIMDRGLKKGFRVVIIFFSKSGYDFAKKRNETAAFFLSPPDTLWHWRSWLDALKPDTIFIVRHEIWPAFMFVGSQYAKIFLINVELNPQKSEFKHKISRILYQRAYGIFVVSEEDKTKLEAFMPLQRDKIFAVGDTKYDRVYERTLSAAKGEASFLPNAGWHERPQLIVGSAWLPDVELVAKAFRQILQKAPSWLLVIVPHDLSQSNIKKIFELLTESGLKPKILNDDLDDFMPANGGSTIIIERMGVLAELYREAHLAFVGGGCHYRVHNVLEPAVFGLPIACGEHYDFSPEARLLVKQGLLQVVYDEKDVFRWWQTWQNKACFRDEKLVATLEELRGAADRIVAKVT